MTPRFARLSLALSALAVSPSLFAQTPPPAAVPPTAGAPVSAIRPLEDRPETLKLVEGTVDSVLDLLTLWTGRVILRPGTLPPVAGGFTIKIERPTPRSEIILYLLTLLKQNGIGVTPMGDGAYTVVPLGFLKNEAPEMIEGSTLNLPPSGKIATKIFQLDFLRVNEFVPLIQASVLSTGIGGGVVNLDKANSAMITDTVSNLQRVETLLKQLDRPATAGLSPKFYTLRNGAKASDVVNKINSIIRGTLQTQLGTSVTLNADDRSNQIVLIADRRQYPFFDELIEKLDIKADPNTHQEVLYLKYAEAKVVAPLLTSLVSGQNNAAQRNGAQSVRANQIVVPGQPAVAPGPVGAPQPPPTMAAAVAALGENGGGSNEFSSLVTVVFDERSNAVIVSGTADDVRLLKNLVDKLDIVLAQVRIEVVIAEVTLSDNATSGISQLGLKVNGDRLVGISGAGAGIGLAGAADASGTGGSGFADISRKGGPRTFTSSLDLSGVIGLSSTNPKATNSLLSVPTISTTHNKQGIIFVGETRPTVTSVTSANAGNANPGASTSSVVPQEIGLTITVTPLIGNDGSVQLNIKQELSDTGEQVTIDGNIQNVINKRRTEQFVTARSGEILVLGGLQKKVDKKSRARLGPIPLIGDLLGLRTRDELRTELIFFLRPIVLTNTEADNVSALKQVEEFPNRDAVRKELDPSYVPPPKSMLEKVRGK